MGEQRHTSRVVWAVIVSLAMPLLALGCVSDDANSAEPVARPVSDNEVVSRQLESSADDAEDVPDGPQTDRGDGELTAESAVEAEAADPDEGDSTDGSEDPPTSSSTTTSTTATSTTTTTVARPTTSRSSTTTSSSTTTTTRPTTTTSRPTTTTSTTTTTTTTTSTTAPVFVLELDFEVDGARIDGVIMTTDGVAVEGIDVRLLHTSSSTNILEAVKTDDAGRYSFGPLSPDCYVTEAEAPAGALFEPFRPDRRFARHRICIE